MSKRSQAAPSKRQSFREQRQKRQRQQRLYTIGAITVGALVLAALLIVPGILRARAPVGEIKDITPREHPQADGTAMGDPNAPVLVETWEDFQCPACQNFAQQIEPQIVQNYVATGKVRYVFRHFPFIDDRSGSKESDQAANASMCAAEQGRFWDYHDILFANWDGENQGSFNDNRLIAFAEKLGLDMGKFRSCFDANRYKDQIDADLQAGQKNQVTGTPSVFVNGQQVAPGYVPTYDQMVQAIEAALSASN